MIPPPLTVILNEVKDLFFSRKQILRYTQNDKRGQHLDSRSSAFIRVLFGSGLSGLGKECEVV